MQFFVYCLMWCAILVFMEKFFLAGVANEG